QARRVVGIPGARHGCASHVRHGAMVLRRGTIQPRAPPLRSRRACITRTKPATRRIAVQHVSTPLTIADVERIAVLAHLELTDEEKQVFTKQLADILSYAEQLQAIDTTGVAATAHVNAHEAERDDQLRPCLPVADALRNAPDGAPDAGLFRVPRVIG